MDVCGVRASRQAARGFTLIELLVVICIIAVLIALLLPALRMARGEARAVACASRIMQTAMAQHIYAADNMGTMRPPWWPSAPPEGVQEWAKAFVAAGYLGDGLVESRWSNRNRISSALVCPEAPNATKHINDPWRGNEGKMSENGRVWVSYMMHEGLAGVGPTANSSGRWAKFTQLASTSVMFVEKKDGWIKDAPLGINNSETHTRGIQGYRDAYVLLMIDYIVMRHSRDTQNIAFVDGSVLRYDRVGLADEISLSPNRWYENLK